MSLLRREFLYSLAGLPAVLPAASSASWRTVEAEGAPTARHECGFAESGGKFYLIGGRGERPTDVYDPAVNRWRRAAAAPLEIHHLQPAAYQDKIYVLGALTGGFPDEDPIPHVLIYDPSADKWTEGPPIPEDRRRGAAGAAVHQGKIYLVCGIVEGHLGGFVNWLDEFDPATGEWRELPDAPRPRDHFQAAVLDGKLYAAGGRTTSHRTGQTMELTIPEADVYDFASGEWTTLDARLPTERAGTACAVRGGQVVVIGGESASQEQAHAEVEAYNPASGRWTALPPLVRGRHGMGAIAFEGALYTAAGSGNRGGGPELTSLEMLPAEA